MMGPETPETCRGWWNILRISSASSCFFLHNYIEMNGQQSVKNVILLLLCFPYSLTFREILYFSTLLSKFSYSVFFSLYHGSFWESKQTMNPLQKHAHNNIHTNICMQFTVLELEIKFIQSSHNKQFTKKFVSFSLHFVIQNLIASSWIY